MSHTAILNAVLRQDLASFIHKVFNHLCPGETYIPASYILLLAWHLEQCAMGKTKRLIINMPPRHLKSLATSVAFAAWVLGHQPFRKLISVTYSQELTDILTSSFRSIVQSVWFQLAFPRFSIKRDTATELRTSLNGYRMSTSLGGTLTGRGGNLIIIDDPMKPGEAFSRAMREQVKAWFDTTLSSRLDNKKQDVIIVVMQRLHGDDLVAHLMEKGGWTVLDLPAIAQEDENIPYGDGERFVRAKGEALCPEREDLATLAQIQRDMGSFNFQAQYLQRPIPEAGQLVKREWLQTYDHDPLDADYDSIVQSWDTAAVPGRHNDYTVGLTFGIRGGDFHLLDVCRGQYDYPTLRRTVINRARRFNALQILVEKATVGIGLVQDLRAHTHLRPIAIPPRGDKVQRLAICSHAIEAGRLHLPCNAPWLGGFLEEVLSFPDGRYDDQVDALTQFLKWALSRRNNFGYGPNQPRPAFLRPSPIRQPGHRFRFTDRGGLAANIRRA